MDTTSTSITTDKWIRQTYGKLHRIAQSKMSHENLGHTLSATALIHEVYMRLSQSTRERRWESEREFLAVVAMEMRRVLIDSARRKKTVKRGRNLTRAPLDDIPDARNDMAQNIIEISEAVTRLEIIAPEKAELVKLRYFLGLTEIEAARTLGISRATAARHWSFARAWLLSEMSKGREEPNTDPTEPSLDRSSSLPRKSK